MSEEHDIEAAQGGDRTAFARLFAVYHPLVHAMLLSRLPPQDAEELLQEVFVTAWLRSNELSDARAFRGWLCAIARNRAVDHWRARRPTEPLALEPAFAASDPLELKALIAAMGPLREAYRETLVLRLVEGMNGPEIARTTGLTEGSVRVNLHRGMALLRERLGGAR